MSKISSNIVYSDLTGGINNVDSKEIINTSTKKTETPEMVNVEYFKLGGIKSMEGNTIFGDVQDSKVIGGWEYTKNDNRYMIIALRNGDVKIYDPISDTFKPIYHFAHQSNRVSFCNMNNGVVITNGIDDLVFYEYGRHQSMSGIVSTVQGQHNVVGTNTKFEIEFKTGDKIDIGQHTYTISTITDDENLTVSEELEETLTDVNIYLSTISQCHAELINTDPELANPPDPRPIRGLALQYYNGRLWVGTSNGLYYSQLGQYNKWDEYYDAGCIGELYNDTSEVKALGLFSDFLVVHKKFSTYLLTLSGVANGEGSTLSIKPFSNITCESQQSWIVSNTKYFVYSKDFMDIYPLVQHTIFSDKFLGEPITKKVRNIFSTIRSSDVKDIFCVSRPLNRQMLFYLPTINQPGSAYALIYDFQTKSWLLRVVPQVVTCAFNFNNNVYIGTEDGLVLKEFSGRYFTTLNSDNQLEDTAIISYYKSPWFDWANGYTQSFSEFIVEIANDFNNDFYIRTQKDGQSRYEDRRISSYSLTGPALVWEGYTDDPNNDTVWGYPKDDPSQGITYDQTIGDNWVRGTFENIRMLLPNNVFEDFQIEIGTNEKGQAFAVYQYGFRRIETDEAPW